MAIRVHRSRLVNFKLTETELQCVQEACVTVGARSLSDFARRAILAFATAPERNNAHSAEMAALQSINDRLDMLDAQLRLLFDRLSL